MINPADISHPIEEFKKWFAEASKIKDIDACAMTLATTSKDGIPSARIVLFKGLDQGDFLFFTNYQSEKSKTLLVNPVAALVFYWHPLNRQIRIQGRVEKTSRKISEDYFKTRPRASQLGALASEQSRPVTGRDELLKNYQVCEAKFEGKEIPCPEYWGGFRVIPSKIEFWMGQPSRLHDRICFVSNDLSSNENKPWQRTFLNP